MKVMFCWVGMAAVGAGLLVGAAGLRGQEVVASSRPMRVAASLPAHTSKNLTTVGGVVLSRVVMTEEEEEEARGQHRGQDYSWDNLPDGRVVVDMKGTGEEILNYLSKSHSVQLHRVTLPAGQYHITVTAAQKDIFNHAAKAFSEAFKLQVVEEDREVDAYRLEGDIKTLKGLPRPESAGEDPNDRRRRAWVGIPKPEAPEPAGQPSKRTEEGTLGELAQSLSGWLRMPVMDGTQLAARYRIQLEWSHEKPLEGISKSLGTQGLKLVPAKKKVMGVHVDAMGAATMPAENSGVGGK